jgi:putative transcriptional regulator
MEMHMGNEFFEDLKTSLEEAVAIAEGRMEAPKGFVMPAAKPAVDVKAIRRRAKLTQSAFAQEFGFTLTQIKDWEQGRSRPLPGIIAYLRLIEKDHEAVRALASR